MKFHILDLCVPVSLLLFASLFPSRLIGDLLLFMVSVYCGTRLLTSESGGLWKQIVGGAWGKIRLCVGLSFLSSIWVSGTLIPFFGIKMILLLIAFILYFPTHGLSIKMLIPQVRNI